MQQLLAALFDRHDLASQLQRELASLPPLREALPEGSGLDSLLAAQEIAIEAGDVPTSPAAALEAHFKCCLRWRRAALTTAAPSHS